MADPQCVAGAVPAELPASPGCHHSTRGPCPGRTGSTSWWHTVGTALARPQRALEHPVAVPQHHPAQIPWGSGRHSSIPMCPASPQRGAQAPGGTSSRAESEGSSVPAFPRILPLLVLQPLPLCGDKLGKSRAPHHPPAAQGSSPGSGENPGSAGRGSRGQSSPRASCSFLRSASRWAGVWGLRTPRAPITRRRARAADVSGRSLAGCR